jgi:DNA-binding XRE family transcriptional regulator
MTVSQEEMLTSLSPEMRERVERRAAELIEEELTLRELRRIHDLTQARMAEMLGNEQDSISRMERRTDMLLSTMSEYIEAMGGKLRLIAEFPDRKPYEVKLNYLNDPVSKPRRRKIKPQGS